MSANTNPSLVSVVVPCYNVEDWVESTVRSALAQTHVPLEVICVDDGSVDQTSEILHRLQAEHPDRLRVVEGDHAGSAEARNKGLALAEGTFVQFLDADGLLEAGKVERQVRLAESAEPPADLVVGAFRRVRANGVGEQVHEVGEDPWVALASSGMGVTSAALWRRSVVEAVGGWSPSWSSSQEYELMFRVLKGGARVAFDREVRTTKRDRVGSISHAYDLPVRESYLLLCSQVLDHLRQERELTPTRERAILSSVFFRLRKMYPMSREAAVAHHRRLIPRSYTPNTGGRNTWGYVALYKLLGFDLAERLRSLKNLRPA